MTTFKRSECLPPADTNVLGYLRDGTIKELRYMRDGQFADPDEDGTYEDLTDEVVEWEPLGPEPE
jgi:hypothetical protein